VRCYGADSNYTAGWALGQATPWLESGAKLGLGTNDLDNIELVEVSLG